MSENTQETETKKSEPITIDDFMRIIYDVFLRTKTRQLFVGDEKSHNDNPNSQDFLNLAYSILKNVSIRIRCKYCIKVSFTPDSSIQSPFTGPDTTDTISIQVNPYVNMTDYTTRKDGKTLTTAFETNRGSFKVEIEKQTDETDEVVLRHILGMVNQPMGSQPIPMYVVDQKTITSATDPSENLAKSNDKYNDDNLLSNKIYEIINSINQPGKSKSESVYIFVEYVKNQQHITIDKIAVYKIPNTAV